MSLSGWHVKLELFGFLVFLKVNLGNTTNKVAVIQPCDGWKLGSLTRKTTTGIFTSISVLVQSTCPSRCWDTKPYSKYLVFVGQNIDLHC